MTDLMETLFCYLNESCLERYFAVDSEYRRASTQIDLWSTDLTDHLDEEGKALFKKFLHACFEQSYGVQRATFQATLALCRELERMFLS